MIRRASFSRGPCKRLITSMESTLQHRLFQGRHPFIKRMAARTEQPSSDLTGQLGDNASLEIRGCFAPMNRERRLSRRAG